jgi:hypothetical protein
MTDPFLYYVVTMSFVCVMTGLFLVYRYFLGNRLTAQANKLKSQMANIKQNFPELQRERGDIVAGGLGEIGLEGIMRELDIDPSILRNPLVKGIIDRYAPKLIEKLAEHGGNKSQSEEVPLL